MQVYGGSEARLYIICKRELSLFKKLSLVSCLTLVEKECFTIGHQVTSHLEFPIISWVLLNLPRQIQKDPKQSTVGRTQYNQNQAEWEQRA